MIDLSMSYWAASQLDRLIPLCEQIVQVRQSKLGEHHPDTLVSMNNLALAYLIAGRFDRLIPFCEQAVRSQQSKLGVDHPDTLTWMSNLANVYERTGQRDRAIPIHEQVVRRGVTSWVRIILIRSALEGTWPRPTWRRSVTRMPRHYAANSWKPSAGASRATILSTTIRCPCSVAA